MNTMQADKLTTPQTRWQRIALHRFEIVKHGLGVTLASLGIAVVLWLARNDQHLDVQFVYSLTSGLASWLVIDLGRFAIDPDSPFRFPRGWRGVTLISLGLITGYVLGTAIGDAYRGGPTTWSLYFQKPSLFVYYFLLSMMLGGSVVYYFYAAARSAYLNQQLEVSQKLAAQAQLQLLQSQLEPHMLFNTLANLRALIETDTPRALSMLDRLNDFLRTALEASRSGSHTLRAEFDRLQDYLELMSVRMGPRLSYKFELADALAHHAVPPMLLQPLVENAIRHGLEPKRSGGSLQISASAQGNTLQLQVRDNGVGVSDEIEPAKGFGLTQVRQRLATLYGEQASLRLSALITGGTNACIEMPLIDVAI